MEIWARAFIYMIAGVAGEVVFTAIERFIQKHDKHLEGHTQLWVMPLYALVGVFVFEKIHYYLMDYNIFLRFCAYAFVALFCEFVAGFFDKQLTGIIPWEYKGRFSVLGYIKLTYFPFWGIMGLYFELIHNLIR